MKIDSIKMDTLPVKSTMSASLNTVAGTIYEDFVMICCAKKHNDERASFMMKVIVVVLGLICVGLVFVVEKLGAILQMAISLSGITSGAIVFVFSFGMLFPWGTSKGALAGLISSMATISWIAGGAQSAIADGKLKFPGKITSVDGCLSNATLEIAHNLTQTYKGVGSPVVTDGTVPLIYQLSYMYYAAAGVIVATIVAIIVSFLTGPQDLNTLDPDLIVPQLQWLLPEKQKQKANPPIKNEYTLVSLNTESEKEQIS